MWHAFRASKFTGRNYVEIDAGVVHALLNARYYSSDRGQFLSEDPTFLAVGNPSQLQQVSKQDQRRFLMDPQQMNSYSYGRDNPITNKDPEGNQFAPPIGLAPLFGAEAISGPVGWAALGFTAVVSGAYVLSNLGEPNWQTFQSVDGNGGGSDPKFPFNKPPGRWGGIALATGASIIILDRGVNVMQDFQSVGQTGAQWQRSQQLTQWGANPSSYVRNVTYSQTTGKPSNTNSGGGGGGSSYASQTYKVPSGAIVDWGGNVVVSAPPPSTKKN